MNCHLIDCGRTIGSSKPHVHSLRSLYCWHHRSSQLSAKLMASRCQAPILIIMGGRDIQLHRRSVQDGHLIRTYRAPHPTCSQTFHRNHLERFHLSPSIMPLLSLRSFPTLGRACAPPRRLSPRDRRLDKVRSRAGETVSNLGVLTCLAFWAARRSGESNVVTFECSVHDSSANLEHQVRSSRRPAHLLFCRHPSMEQPMDRAFGWRRRDWLTRTPCGGIIDN